MITIPSTEAKICLGTLLHTVQRAPGTIEKKGHAVAVLISETEYQAYKTEITSPPK